MIKNIMKSRGLLFTAFGVISSALLSCASIQSDTAHIAAYVDNDPITIGDIEYSLQVAHRREDMSSATGINISDYLNTLIDERLLVHEAGRMNLDRHPELIQKVDAYVLRESVVRLYSEEILSKVTVSEEDITDYFKKEYMQYNISSIETDTAADAEMILDALKGGVDFDKLVRESVNHDFRKGVEEAAYVRKNMNKGLKKIIDSLEPGETSNVFELGHRHYLLKLISRQNAPEDEMVSKREEIEQALRQIKVKKRSDEYLDYLRRKMKPVIRHDLLSLIPHDGNREEREKWLQDRRPLVTLRDAALTVGDVVKMMRPGKGSAKDSIIKQWIDRKAVDYEALDRKYAVNTDLKDKTLRYKNKMLIKLYADNVLLPEVEMSEDELMDFYHNNPHDFSLPSRYKLQQITTKTEQEAEAVKKELMKGADFSWVARNRSYDNYASEGGTVGWRGEDLLPFELKEVVMNLKPGEISDVMVSGDMFRIYRILEKTDNQVEAFEKVRPSVHKKMFGVKYRELYETYVSKLKKEADIEINNDVVQDLERRLKHGTS